MCGVERNRHMNFIKNNNWWWWYLAGEAR